MAGSKIEAASIWARTCRMRSVAQQHVDSLALPAFVVAWRVSTNYDCHILGRYSVPAAFYLRSKLRMLSGPALGTRRSLFALSPSAGSGSDINIPNSS